MVIRRFENIDLDGIQSLMKSLGYERNVENIKYSMGLFLENELNRIFVSEQNNEITGYVAVSIYPLLVTEFNRCRIENLVVKESFRRKGVATELIKAVEDYAKNTNVSIIDVTSSLKRKNSGAYDFYHKNGYKNDGMEKREYFRKRIR